MGGAGKAEGEGQGGFGGCICFYVSCNYVHITECIYVYK